MSGPHRPGETAGREDRAGNDRAGGPQQGCGDGGEDAVFTALVAPAGWTFAAPAAQPLLKAALAAGIRLPSSCRNGTCRACICRLAQGRVAYRIEWPGLSAEEKREGWILPCVAHPLSDLEIEGRAERTGTGPGR